MLLTFKKIKKPSDIETGVPGLYKIMFDEGNYYIGETADIRNRLYSHQGKYRKNKHKNEKLNNAFKTFGEPELFMIETYDHKQLEKEYLKKEKPVLNKRIPPENIIKQPKNKGYYWNIIGQLWIVKYKNKYVGRFKNEDDAHNAYLKAKGKIKYAEKR